MKAGELADGAAVLRAKLDMASPNINLRDPVIYRIKRATHHNTGDAWCIYPMYAYAHPIEDALENITHSICTLEFEDQRPWYDWLLDTLCELGLLARPRPHQYEFARLNVTYVITSKRKLKALVDERIVAGWDDPRMPTIAGLRRRGYTPESLRLMCERAGTSKAGGWTEYASLDAALRDDLDPKAPRAMAVLDPVELRLTNWAALFGSDAHREACHAPVHPQTARARRAPLRRSGPSLWIERDDFAEVPREGLLPPLPRQPGPPQVRLRHRVHRLREGRLGRASPRCSRRSFPTRRAARPAPTRSRSRARSPGSAPTTAPAPRCGSTTACSPKPQPDAGGKDFKASLNPKACASSPATSRPRWPTPRRTSASRSSATATSSPSGTTTRPAGRCSIGSRRCAKPGLPSNAALPLPP